MLKKLIRFNWSSPSLVLVLVEGPLVLVLAKVVLV